VPIVANDGTVGDAEEAVGRAQAAFTAWRNTDAKDRANVLVRVAKKMRDRRDELAGVMCREAGKVWREADGDICEAIDFCEYYARCAPGLFKRERLGKFIGELDEQWYQARGVAVVIAPWNFPLAICTGMTAAALVCGNTVVVKPAEQTPGIASIMAGMISEAIGEQFGGRIDAGGVFRLLPGEGETVGAALVRDPRVSLLAFTGSKAVGLDIIRAAGATGEAQLHVKKVVCEMGGKNAIIVDTSADLDEAVVGVRDSAFGFQGQKCSACSRVIVVDPQGADGPQMQLFTERLVGATRALIVGSPIEAGTDVGPVIDKDSYDKVHSYIRKGGEESTLLLGDADFPRLAELNANSPEGVQPAHYVGPHIFGGVAPEHAIAREEIFGPVLAVIHAGTFDEALRIANDSPYKLTGGVFSRMPSHLDRAKREYRVGNLYLNRGCTGALVARQPFGGFGMSGVGSKAGGRDYLLQFVEPRASCENTMRRGFAPEL
jgi:RHH-type proline utilization regulon transcriptional repressor/proline dehydrogenase/delta 1-pyrroline-5-carboxylate dehydrogenase